MAFDPESLFLPTPGNPVMNETARRRRDACMAAAGRYSLRSCAEDAYGGPDAPVSEMLPDISAEDLLPLPEYERGIPDIK